jgi:O-antigen/teichoic acid export membrane protein
MGNTDAIMLGMWCTISEVGIYRVAMRIAGLVTLPLLAVAAIAGPKFAEIGRHADPARLKEVTRFTSRLLTWSSVPLCLLVLLSGRLLLGIFGKDFVAGYPALLIIALAQGINALCGVVGVFLEMTGYERALRNGIIAGAACNVVLNLLLIPPFGITGAAVATAASTLLWNGVVSIFALRRFGFWVGYVPGSSR